MSAGRPAYVVMASADPDRDDGDWNRAYTATGKAIVYDPSNGTISDGDIWRASVFVDSTLFRKEFDMEYYQKISVTPGLPSLQINFPATTLPPPLRRPLRLLRTGNDEADTGYVRPRARTRGRRKENGMTKWDPAEYASHSSAQLRWARELMARLNLRGDESLLDIGCGDGKITAEIARHLPNGFIVGTDQSADMIDFARKTFPPDKLPNLEFIQMDARELRLDRAFDLAFSNATLHWVDDHRAVLRGVHDLLKPGGRIVFSFGGKGNADAILQVVHQFMHHDPWRPFFETFTFRYLFLGPDEYMPLLEECGFRVSVCRLVPKDMVHEGEDGLAGWVRTTWIPYTQRVPEDRREAFIAEIVTRYLELHPPDAEDRVHVPMVRLEVDAVRD